MAGKKGETAVAVPPTEKELVQQRVGDANAIVQEFVAAIFSGVQSKVLDLRADLEAGLAAARVRDALGRLTEINAEVQQLADEAAAAADDVTFRLLVTQIAILKGSYGARYAAAVGVVPGAADPATIAKEVDKVFEAVVAGVKAKRKEAATRPPAAAPAELPVTLGPGPAVRELPAAAPAESPAPVLVLVAAENPEAASDPGSTEPSVASSPAGQWLSSEEPIPEPPAEAIPDDSTWVSPEELPGEPTEELLAELASGREEETGPSVVPQVGFPPEGPSRRSKRKSGRGSPHFAGS